MRNLITTTLGSLNLRGDSMEKSLIVTLVTHLKGEEGNPFFQEISNGEESASY